MEAGILELATGWEPQLAVFLLALARMTGLFAIAPLFACAALPGRLRVLIAAGAALCLAPVIGGGSESAAALLADPFTAALALAAEAGIGVAVGLVAAVAVGAARAAGGLISQDLGLTIGGVIDPLSGGDSPALANLKAGLAVMVLLGLDLHHHLIRILAGSFDAVPPGALVRGGASGLAPERLRDLAAGEGAFLFAAAVQIALPVIAALFLVSAAMAVLARAVPEMNVFVAGFGARSLVGLWVTALMFPLLLGAFTFLGERMVASGWAVVRAVSGS